MKITQFQLRKLIREMGDYRSSTILNESVVSAEERADSALVELLDEYFTSGMDKETAYNALRAFTEGVIELSEDFESSTFFRPMCDLSPLVSEIFQSRIL